MIHEEDLTKEQNKFIDALEEWIDNADVHVSVILDHEYTSKPQERPDIDTIRKVCTMEGVS